MKKEAEALTLQIKTMESLNKSISQASINLSLEEEEQVAELSPKLKATKKKIEDIHIFITKNRNVHTELKEMCGSLRSTINSVAKEYIRDKTSELEKGGEFTREIKRLGEIIRNHNEPKSRLCEKCAINADTMPDTLKSIPSDITYEIFQEIEDKTWEEKAYKNTETKVRDPTTCRESSAKVVFIEPGNEKMAESIQRIYLNRYPNLGEIKEDYGSLYQAISIRNSEGVTCKDVQVIYKIKTEHDQKHLWDKLQKLKEEKKEGGTIAFHHLKSTSVIKLRKILEAVFQGAKNRLIIYTTRRKLQEQGEGNPKDRERTTGGGDRNTYALILKSTGDDYKDTLAKIKNTVQDPKNAKHN
ncbi:unnamed protein product [Brassicogethes aeneus]|uniref:Uncharacterized protein n=1 Tax=Brassicogethes aeneus TaxID=1431903 RepID=A0A9P0BFF7_BRAAE|nr:unnamed protein product [Brassicogethes aeneus]